MLCAVCIYIFQVPLRYKERGWTRSGRHHNSFGDLVKAANSGCKICKTLCRSRDDHGPDEVGELKTRPFIRFRVTYPFDKTEASVKFLAGKARFDPRLSWLDSNLDNEIVLRMSRIKETPDWWSRFLKQAEKDLFERPWHVGDDNFPRRILPVNTGDEEVLRRALEWLRFCQSEHETCRHMDNMHDSKHYPRRILNVGHVDSPVCRLLVVENEQPTAGSGYVALSHCWGRNSFLTLTSNNIVEFQEEIPLYRLPKSFADSVHICRWLGYQYLWIDSLCILQSGPGSEEDWQLHATMMDLIYANCELNLAIAWAANAEQGAFVDRDPDFLRTAFVYAPPVPTERDVAADYADLFESTTGDKVRTIEDGSAEMPTLLTILAHEYDTHASLWDLPLQTRGWVFQERLLARRTLYFGKDRIYWECNKGTQNEYHPQDITKFESPTRAYSLPEVVLFPTLTQSTESNIICLQEKWRKMVEDYSGTHLTYPNKDKLVAIAAIAKQFHLAIPGDYIAGLFSSDLCLGLMWYNDNSAYFGRRISASFEWTSEDYWEEIILPDSRRDTVYRAPSWSWASVDRGVQYGWDVEDDYRNFLATVVSTCVKLEDPHNPYGQLSAAKITIEGPISNIKPITPDPARLHVGEQEIESFEGTDQLVALHMFEHNPDPHDDIDRAVYGLVLAPNDHNTYRRVGYFHCWPRYDSTYHESRFERATVTIV